VHNLVELMRIRGLLRTFGAVRGERSKGSFVLGFSPDARIDAQKLLALAQAEPERYRLGRSLTLAIALPPEDELSDIRREVYEPTLRALLRIAREERPGTSSEETGASMEESAP
jgi:hypothetical protein